MASTTSEASTSRRARAPPASLKLKLHVLPERRSQQSPTTGQPRSFYTSVLLVVVVVVVVPLLVKESPPPPRETSPRAVCVRAPLRLREDSEVCDGRGGNKCDKKFLKSGSDVPFPARDLMTRDVK